MAVAAIKPDFVAAWRGPSLLITNTRGECGADQALSGFYFREARHLRTLELRINGRQPWLCEVATPDTRTIAVTYVYPEITQPGGGGTGQAGDDEGIDADGIPERSLDVRLVYRVTVAQLAIELTIANRARRPVHCTLTWNVSADFADIQEAQVTKREQDADVIAGGSDGALSLTYDHPQLPLQTLIRHDQRWSARHHTLNAPLILAPQQREVLTLSVVPIDAARVISIESASQREQALRQWQAAMTRIEAPGNRLFEAVVASNVDDIASLPLLDGAPDEWLAPQAGMPAYPAFFGRDGVTAGWQAGMLDCGVALEASLTKLRRLQTDRFDDWRDEQPGRIPYQVRSGPLARLDLNPYAAYYADYASPLMFVISLANLWAWTGDRARIAPHWDAARRLMDWAREYGDADRDGYLEYRTRSSKGTKNQGWKDSGDAIVYDDGAPVPAPIATCELQGYWYIAQQLMALLSPVMGASGDAAAFRKSAAALKEHFNRDWWVEREQFYALALDPDKRQVAAVTSNVGHCLACGILARDRLPAVVGRLFAPDMFSGWGVRTLSTRHAFYNPLSYHRGTVWAVEQATILFGLRRFGFDARALDLAGALFDLAQLYPAYRIPECVGGYARGEAMTPGAYPRANPCQLWNATTFPLAVQTMLGLVPFAAANTLIVDPVLPPWLPELLVRDLRVGAAKVSLRFWRERDGASAWEPLHTQGTLHIVRQPPPESGTSWSDRVEGVLESLLKGAL